MDFTHFLYAPCATDDIKLCRKAHTQRMSHSKRRRAFLNDPLSGGNGVKIVRGGCGVVDGEPMSHMPRLWSSSAVYGGVDVCIFRKRVGGQIDFGIN